MWGEEDGVGSGPLPEPAPFCFPHPTPHVGLTLGFSFLSALPGQVSLGGGEGWRGSKCGWGQAGAQAPCPLAPVLPEVPRAAGQLWEGRADILRLPHKLANQGLEGGAEAAPRPRMRGGHTATISGAEGRAGTQQAEHRLADSKSQRKRETSRQTDRDREERWCCRGSQSFMGGSS